MKSLKGNGEFNGDHGRIEERSVWMTDSVEWLKERHSSCKSINNIIIVQSIREMKGLPETKSQELRSYISSHKKQDAKWIASAIRKHWQVENNLHWQFKK